MSRRRNRPRRLAPMSTPLEIRKCLLCDAEYMPNRSWQKYCCPEHSLVAYYQRKFGGTAPPPADAKPNIVSKLEEFKEAPYIQDEITKEAVEMLDKGNVRATPASKALSGLGYEPPRPNTGIPELDTTEDEKDEDLK